MHGSQVILILFILAKIPSSLEAPIHVQVCCLLPRWLTQWEDHTLPGLDSWKKMPQADFITWPLTPLLGLPWCPPPWLPLLSSPSLCLGCKAVLRLSLLSALSSQLGPRLFQIPSLDFILLSSHVPALDQTPGSFSQKCCWGMPAALLKKCLPVSPPQPSFLILTWKGQ